MSKGNRDELVERVNPVFLEVNEAGKGQILDEVFTTTGYCRVRIRGV